MRSALAALAGLEMRALVTVGERADPSDFGEAPPNVRVARWVPQAQVLKHAAAMLCHGGFGTVLGGLYAGVPMVTMPMLSDQPRNSARIEALGAGVTLARGHWTAPEVRDALLRVLTNPAYGAAARRVAAEVSTLPPVEDAVGFLQQQAG
jgi:MGT family glycosyltransferase